MPSPRTPPPLTLYSNYRSSCSARLRLALNFHKIPYTCVSIDTSKGEQHSPTYRELNPSCSVPTLVVPRTTTTSPAQDNEISNLAPVVITQSTAALEYLEEAFPRSGSARHGRLLPPDPVLRAHIRSLCEIIVSDTQPLTSTRVFPRIEDLGGDRVAWSKVWFRRGLAAFEALAAARAGRYSVGDEVTLADVCLVPAVWKAESVGMEVGEREFPVISGVYERLSRLEEVKRAHWRAQRDTPVEERWRDDQGGESST